MRFTGLFAAATLAASAFASPVAQKYEEGPSKGSAVDSASPVDVTPQVGTPVAAVSSAVVSAQEAAPTGATYKDEHHKTVESCEEVIVLFEEHVKSIKGCTSKINSTVGQYEEGSVSEDDATKDITALLEEIEAQLQDIVDALTDAVGIDIEGAQLDKVLNLLNILIAELLATVNTIVKALGLGGALSKILHIVFGLLAKILHLLIGILHGLLPGLLAILTPLLSGLGKGLLAPILEPVLGLLGGLGAIL